jgi:DNA repair exonuclease SbcCD ATPase subunit
VVSFREPAQLDGLLSDDFAQEFQAAIGAANIQPIGSPQVDLVKRRDALAQRLETRIAGQRQTSRELDDRWHELDRLVHECKQELEQSRDRLRAADTELAEIESWLRCRRIGTVDERQLGDEPDDREGRMADLDEQIVRWRAALAELERRQADVRTQLAQIHSHEDCVEITLVDQRARLAATRRLVADLQGEVARLARASQSDECVCGDAHPRFRPIITTLLRQLDALDALADQQEQAARTAELEDEEGHLARSQVELRNQLNHLLDRHRSLDRSSRRLRSAAPLTQSATPAARGTLEHNGLAWGEQTSAEECSSRRFELWRERSRLHDQLAALEPRLRSLRAERDEVERQRTDVLSPRATRDLHKQLTEVQHQLEQSTNARHIPEVAVPSTDGLQRASDFLAQITDGELVQLRLARQGRETHVVNRSGDSCQLGSLSPAERDQVHWSLCLALVSACRQQGVYLPLVLDEPFERLDGRTTTALTAVIDEFGRRGQQMLLFTAHSAAVERFAALGATVHNMAGLFQDSSAPPLGLLRAAVADVAAAPRRAEHRATATSGRRPAKNKRREAG